jgi:D-alanyl-lipoteichoic acid acyltransferase DltB (MBOAT superfamily)
MAIGTAKLFGFELMSNFKFPYFSRTIGEFWRRWHISLSTWFRDYLYIPLGGSKKGGWGSLRNIFIIFIVSGFWHGANWTFIVWGLFHSLLFIPSFILKNNRKNINSIVGQHNILPTILELYQVITTFILVTIGWVFFRSQNIQNSLNYLSKGLEFDSNFDYPSNNILVYLTILIIVEWNGRYDERDVLGKVPKKLTFMTLLIIISLIIINFTNESQEFIYFDF